MEQSAFGLHGDARRERHGQPDLIGMRGAAQPHQRRVFLPIGLGVLGVLRDVVDARLEQARQTARRSLRSPRQRAFQRLAQVAVAHDIAERRHAVIVVMQFHVAKAPALRHMNVLDGLHRHRPRANLLQ
ncbi:hypothetical protein D3C81_1516580 [compost metagenome]